MGLLDKILGNPVLPAAAPEHAVLVYFQYGRRDLSELFEVEQALENVINEAAVGEFDGNEIAIDGSDGTLFMYGPSADALFAAVRPTLESVAFLRGARVVLRYGPPSPGVAETAFTLPLPRA